MKLKQLTFAGIAAFMLLSCGEATKTEENTTETAVEEVETTYTLDVANSLIEWKGQMIGGLYFHTGTLNLSKGTVTISNGSVKGGTFEIDWSTIATTDNNYTAETPSENLVNHLKSPDFFATDSLGAASFEITGSEGSSVMGKLTLRGVTSEETVKDVVITETEAGVEATGKLTFDRQKYGASYKNTYSDAVISDDIELVIKLKATK